MLTFIIFRFAIGEADYSWHQPEHMLNYDIELTVPDHEIPAWSSKSPKIPPEEMPKALALARWVVDNWTTDVSEETGVATVQAVA